MTSVKVPGKVMLTGEYAVLYGGTSVVVPVPRFLTISDSISSKKPQLSHVVRLALDYPISRIQEYEQRHGQPNLEIDYSQFVHTGPAGSKVKLGLGSSAAEAVGVTALRMERAGITWQDHRQEVARIADAVHREAQGGTGSGADVAGCAYASAIRFRRDSGGTSVEEVYAEWKNYPPAYLVWTGQAADTRSLVRQFQEWLAMSGKSGERSLKNLVDASNRVAKAWFEVPFEKLCTVVDSFSNQLDICAKQAGLELKLAIHHELEEFAKRHNGFAKPTGAGGGDMILLMGNVPFDELDLDCIPLGT